MKLSCTRAEINKNAIFMLLLPPYCKQASHGIKEHKFARFQK